MSTTVHFVDRGLAAALSLFTALVLAGCGSQGAIATGTPVGHATLLMLAKNERPTRLDLGELTAGQPFTVLTFFSAHCPCQKAHDRRLRQLHETFSPRGVAFYAIDAEAGATAERAAAEARRRSYLYPLLSDPSGASIDVLGAAYATYTVVVDRLGRVRYSGGIDSDRTHLTPDATPFLRMALDDLLDGREPSVPHGRTLGCALQR